MRNLILATALLALPPLAQAGPLNDTGTDSCRDHATHISYWITATVTCAEADGGQDGRYGRDAAAAKGLLAKVGQGKMGFDFTKIGNDGSARPADTTLGAGPGDWACSYDNNTGLMWELKTTSGLRSRDHTYTWFDSAHSYGGDPGVASGGTCDAADRCDTEKYVADVNAAGLCGHNDWRLPTYLELVNVVDRAYLNAAMDPLSFPNTPAEAFWTATPQAGNAGNAWSVHFYLGYGGWNLFGDPLRVRLVRTGP